MIKLFILIFVSFSVSLARANEVTAILSLKKGSEVQEQELQRLLSRDIVADKKELLSVAEQKQLKAMKLGHLAKAWLVQLKSDEAFQILERRIRRAGLPLYLDYNEMEFRRYSKSDPFSGFQWGLLNRGLPQTVDIDPVQNYALPARTGVDIQLSPLPAGKEIIVAVLDTGLNKSHPDLVGRISYKDSECKALEKFKSCLQEESRVQCEEKWFDLKNPEVDLDGNGYPLDCSGWSLLGGINKANIMGRPDFDDDQGHGTHVAGIIAAEIGNNIGVRGVSSHVKILPVQVLGKQPSEPLKPLSVSYGPDEKGKETYNKSLGDLVARGVIYAMLSGAKVINFSMGWPQNRDSQFMREVIAAAQSQGILIIAAAGNDSTKALLRPCAYPGVLCVGAHGPDGSLAHFSNYGGGVDIAAPGLNILSTYPLEKRPVRFRSTTGYEFLSGTSQASPFVAGVAAELLAQGIPAQDVFPRLLAAAAPAQDKLNLLVGTQATGYRSLAPEKELEVKTVNSGLLRLQQALLAQPVPLIHLSSKERSVINWDRKSANLVWTLDFENTWKDTDSADLSMVPRWVTTHPDSIRPLIASFREEVPYAGIWKRGEKRRFQVSLKIVDDTPERSRIPSELELLIEVSHPLIRRELRAEADILVAADENLGDAEVLAIPQFPKGRTSLIPIDDNRDTQPERRDYFVELDSGSQKQLWVLVENNQQKQYSLVGPAKIRVDGDADLIREQSLVRMDWNFDGKSEWVLGLLEDRSEEEENNTISPVTYYVFDENMKLIKQWKLASDKTLSPYQVQWMRLKDEMVPAWVGPGKDPQKKRGLRDMWENPNNNEATKIRLYYVNTEGQLAAFEKYNSYQVADLLEPTLEQKQKGILPVLMSKNRGSSAKPSYVYDFALALVQDGQVLNFENIFMSDRGDIAYRNILETRVDRVYNLDPSEEEFAGTFWFGEGVERSQRLSFYSHIENEWFDEGLFAERRQYDSALWVRAVFSGRARKGAFVLTNSEIQYQDLVSKRTTRKSLDRYTFYPDMLFTNLYFPVVLEDSQTLDAKLPAIFTTETSGLSRGVRVLAPVFAKDGEVMELVSPARLRLAAGNGCRPLDTPVFLGKAGGYAMDYFCRDKMIRVKLKF